MMKCLLLRKFSSDNSGFTLVEVLVALTIFSIGLLALAGMQITGITGNTRAQSLTAKTALADGVVEEFLAMDGDDANLLTAVTDSAWTTVDIEGAGTCNVLVSVVVDPVIDGTTHTGLSQITVTASNPKPPNVVKTVMKRRF
ncbi:type IV pilus assembly protein PilV [Malonomonas rubra DSM 5091]|uniref:Type IV pilus assembly protein PilV n=1 Tax=Malonomonas rubra DSM 5091 TaxID=1122189 RepID=A0A1M6BLP1_MALRU|nr:prepilin-type N-terminal cleavage/methylation domain-containing protein [Malonomonas rubra]SHI49624.1 type IV pilus assembly protein PilV [Malonomonas rubra DSM 5091]